jgi:hypothetical protein
VSFIGGLFDSNEGELRKLRKTVTRINQFEPEIAKRTWLRARPASASAS